MSIPVIFNPQIVIYRNKSSCDIPLYTGMKKKNTCAEMKISCQTLSHRGLPETLLAAPAVERVFAPKGVITRCLRHATAFLRSVVFHCPVVEEVTCLQVKHSPCVC